MPKKKTKSTIPQEHIAKGYVVLMTDHGMVKAYRVEAPLEFLSPYIVEEKNPEIGAIIFDDLCEGLERIINR